MHFSHTGAQLGCRGLASPDCVHLWVKFSIQNVVFRVSRRKKPLRGLFFWCFWRILYRSALGWPVPQTSPCPEKFLVAHLSSDIFFSFCKALHLKGFRVSWIRLCLDNCSVICTYVICRIRHIQNSGIFNTLFFQVYTGKLNHIQRYWGIKAYSGLFRHIQHPV